MGKLDGKVAIVTGASRGIGLAIAEAFAREGAKVAICGRKLETIQEAGRAISHPGRGRVLPVAAHVGKPADLEALVRTTESELGNVDILVNNAATNIAQGPCLDFDEGQFDKMVEVNLKSTFRLIKLVAPGMLERGRGSIINIASVAGMRPQFHSMLYSMTKAALIMMTQSCALEFGARNVRVNAIAPGLIQTQLSEYFWNDEERMRKQMSRQVLQRSGKPSEIAEAALLLAGDGSEYLTGQTLVVDGGLLITGM
ncbi:MAG: SDR family oxidoreductase [Bryobacteraceae bacterium]|nr:SDR family oxidoreductase [Bryobacteraceae bacterium]